ncbi:uncharacterized protein LOC124356232 [Homalodisca vitripennis]|uniref:uncharacterized protein LOC124356232 n=1 Tax=Homalodisca vitripennis TaxID=197043 RepID=UPI001EE9ECD4|nr:uncharacterized protein LOC124356232 [Homalodisca vitripennis]
MDAQELNKKASLDEKLAFMIQMYGDYYPVVNIPGLVGHKALRMYRLVRETVSESHVSWGVRKNSQLLKPLSIATLRFMEVGLPKLWLDEVIQRWPMFDTRHLMEEEDEVTFSQPRPLQLTKMLGIFYKLLFGFGICTILFVFEVLWL